MNSETTQKGCLLLLNESTCNLCDFPNNYFLQSDLSCEKLVVENCQVPQYNGKCLICDDGYFVDLTGFCVKISVTN